MIKNTLSEPYCRSHECTDCGKKLHVSTIIETVIVLSVTLVFMIAMLVMGWFFENKNGPAFCYTQTQFGDVTVREEVTCP